MKAINLKSTLILALLALAACERYDRNLGPDGLPAATHSGAYTLGCLINGKPFIPSATRERALSSEYYALKYNNEVGEVPYFTITALGTRADGKQQCLFIGAHNIKDTGTYRLCRFPGAQVVWTDGDTNYTVYDTCALLHITHFDTAAKVAAGTFQFRASAGIGSKQYADITQGRFDVPLNWVSH